MKVVNRAVLCFLALVAVVMTLPAVAGAQENVVRVTICDGDGIAGCEGKTRSRAPFRMVFDPEVLTVDCDEENGACSNESSRVVWEVTNKQEDHDADIKYTGGQRGVFTEQRIKGGDRRSVSLKPRNLNFDSNGKVSWRYEIIVRDAAGKIYARKDPEIVIRRRDGGV